MWFAANCARRAKTIGQFQAVANRLVGMKLRCESSRLLLYRAAWLKQQGHPASAEAAMAKLYLSEAWVKSCLDAVQIHGGYGYTKDYPVERMMRDAKICEIGEGTSEIQRIVISRHILRELAD